MANTSFMQDADMNTFDMRGSEVAIIGAVRYWTEMASVRRHGMALDPCRSRSRVQVPSGGQVTWVLRILPARCPAARQCSGRGQPACSRGDRKIRVCEYCILLAVQCRSSAIPRDGRRAVK